jgi:hypothetical protein
MFNRINLVQCKIALGFVLTAIVFYVFKDNVAEAQNISHYGMTVWLHVLESQHNTQWHGSRHLS